MKLFKLLPLMALFAVLAPIPQVYAGAEKAGSVFPRNLSVEEIARMVYDAAKKDPENAALIYLDALNSRDSWTKSEMQFVTEALLLAVPSLATTDLKSIVGQTTIPQSVTDAVFSQINRNDGISPDHVINAIPPNVPIFPLLPSPNPVSGAR